MHNNTSEKATTNFLQKYLFPEIIFAQLEAFLMFI